MRSSAVLVAALVVLIAACSDDDDGSSAGIASITGDFGEVVEPGGTVLAVSTGGRALVEQDDQVCVVDLTGDGEDAGCVTVGASLAASSVVFSPDGSKVAFDGLADMLRALDSDVRVLDVESGEVVTIADDGGDDDPTGPQDVLPAWVDDDELAFLRLSGLGTDEPESAEVVFAELDGDEVDSVNASDGVGPRDVVVGSSAAVVDDRYVLATGGDQSRLVAVDDDDGVEVVADLDGPGGSVGGTSRDAEQAVVVINGPTLDRLPAVHVTTDGDDVVVVTSSPFPTAAATVSPDGSIVAAATVDEGGRTSITLWDPDVGDQRRLEPGDGVPTLSAVSGVVWTDDDRIVMWSSSGWQVVDVR